MKNEKSSSIFDVLKDAGIKDAQFYKMLFDNLNILNNLGAVEIIDKSDGSGGIIRFGFFH